VTFRRALYVVALAAIVATCIDLRMMQMPFVARDSKAEALDRNPDRLWPLYPQFLEGVYAHTRPGDTIALIVPQMRWEPEYVYAYFRACYFLAGREVLPLVDPQDRKLQQNFSDARYVAVFGVTFRGPAVVVWQGDGGMLLRLQR
jgi:hypothetical protein